MTLTLEMPKIPNAPKFARLRKQRGMTLDDVIQRARELGVTISRQTVRNVELGKGDPKSSTITTLAAIYEVEEIDSLYRIAK